MLTSMKDVKRLLAANMAADIPTMISGPPGVGKSQAVKQLAKERGWGSPVKGKRPQFGLIDFRATLRDAVDLRGLPMVDVKSGVSRWLSPAELPNVERDGAEGILFLDELPQAAQSVQIACFSLVLDRCIGEYKLPPGWRVLAAGNRLGDRAGIQKMPTALRNRFAHFEVAAELEPWTAWAVAADLNPLVIAFLRFRPQFLHRMPEGEENSFPTPRAWENVAKIAGEKDETMRFQLVAALVGEDVAGEFEAFVRIWARLPSIDQILRDPRGVAVPSLQEPALIYAVAGALARRMSAKNAGAALLYAKRLPKEFEVLVAVDAVRRDPDIKATRAFAEWFSNNSEVII